MKKNLTPNQQIWKDRRKKMIHMKKEGHNLSQIAREFKISRQRVYQIFNNNIVYGKVNKSS